MAKQFSLNSLARNTLHQQNKIQFLKAKLHGAQQNALNRHVSSLSNECIPHSHIVRPNVSPPSLVDITGSNGYGKNIKIKDKTCLFGATVNATTPSSLCALRYSKVTYMRMTTRGISGVMPSAYRSRGLTAFPVSPSLPSSKPD